MCFSVMIPTDLDVLGERMATKWVQSAFDAHEEKSHQYPKAYKSILEHPRIFPNYHAPIILWEKGRRVGRPMRYRLHPHWTPKEIPSKYNLFNARLDSLETRRSWKALFMKRHGLLCFERFYEWVEDPESGKKRLLSFAPDREMMWAPVLWDRWSDGKEVLESFALITTDPPPEISMMGHDRCPIFLREDRIDTWLQPEKATKKKIYALLHDLEEVTYSYTWAKAA